MQEGNRILGIKKNIVTAMHKVMLIAILHSTFVAPCQGMYNDFFSDKNQLVYKGFSEMYSKTDADENDLLKTVVPVSNSVVSNRNIVPVVVKKTVVNPFKQRANYFVEADVKIGFIGVSKEQPMDNPADNLFKLIVDEFPVAKSRVFLTYDLFGVQDLNGVSRSINQRLASGGYVVKQQNGWTSQKEEINQEWLNVGENQIMFTVPKGANFGYQIKNLKIEFEKVEENSLLTNIVLNSSGINFIKNNELYLKGFLRNNGVKVAQVFVDDHLINTNDGEFEGFVKLTDVTKNRKFIVIRAQNASGLLGQEIINLDNLLEADKIYPVEVTNEKVLMPVKAFEKATVEIDGGRLVLGDSALLVDKTIAITRLRAIDIAPLSSGMINVTKGGHGYRFLPEGTKFNKPVSIAIGYDEQLLPKGYSTKDIKTFYFNTNSKNWIAVKRDTISVEDRVIFAKTDHFTDYINGIIQAPESPETAGFTPTMMNDIKAADPSAEMTIISPPEVSQKGDANISYPIKIPSGRKGMQPNLALQYSNEGGNGWAGLGWSMSTPAITIDSRWGVPELNNNFETVIYTLNGEQLMYQKIKNIDNSYSDWMPNRHYDASLNSTVYTTSARPRIVNAIFTPRKQGSFAKIERLGTSVDNYYWKVTGTDGTVNWFGGDETGLNNNAIIKNDSGAIVHWGMTKTIDVYFNNVIYIYDNYIIPNSNDANENLNGGRVFNIKNIYYTGTKTTKGEYSVTFETDNSSIREDVGLNARLGLKQVEPYRLNKIIVSLKAVPIRSYRLNYLKGAFGKYLLSDVSEYEGNNSNSKEFYKHVFDYYDNVTDKKRGSNVPITISSVPYDVPINVAPDFSFGIDLLNPSITNANETFQWEWGVRPAAGIDFPDSSDDPASLLTIGAPFGESYSKSRGKVTMSDMNGDGLDDVVYRSGDDLKYMPHLKDNDGKDIFGSEKSIFNINNFYRNIGLTKTVFGDSWDVSLFWDGYFGTKRFKTFADTDIYFTDGNGDGLPDIVNDSKVYFNKLESNGDITYGTSSQPTPNMLITADTNFIDATRVPDKDPIKDYLYDVVRVWEAPREGIIGINDNVIFMPVTAQDKLTYSIETQLGNNCQPFRVYLKEFTNTITTDNLAITNYNGNNPALGYSTVSSCNPQTNLTGMHVYEGQKIYFREHKTRVGNNEELKTNPEIYYIQGVNNPYPTTETDANNINLNSIKHDESFILSESQSAEVKNTGTYKINWNPINVANLTDAVTYKIVRTETAPGVLPIKTIVYEKTVSQGTSFLVTPATNAIVGQNISNIIVSNIPGRHKIFYNFYVLCDSNVKWKNIELKPSFEYTPDTNALAKASKTYPVALHDIYREKNNDFLNTTTTTTYPNWSVPTGVQTISVLPRFSQLAGANKLLTATDQGSFMFIVKKNGATVGKIKIVINAGAISLMPVAGGTIPITFSANMALANKLSYQFVVGDKIALFEKFNHDVTYGMSTNVYGYKNVILGYGNISYNSSTGVLSPAITSTNYVSANSTTLFKKQEHLGPMYRGWGQFLYASDADPLTTTPTDLVSKLINTNLVNDPYSASLTNIANVLGVDLSTCTSSDLQTQQNCTVSQINQAFNLPAVGTITQTNISDIVKDLETRLGNNKPKPNAFMKMTAYRFGDCVVPVETRCYSLNYEVPYFYTYTYQLNSNPSHNYPSRPLNDCVFYKATSYKINNIDYPINLFACNGNSSGPQNTCLPSTTLITNFTYPLKNHSIENNSYLNEVSTLFSNINSIDSGIIFSQLPPLYYAYECFAPTPSIPNNFRTRIDQTWTFYSTSNQKNIQVRSLLSDYNFLVISNSEIVNSSKTYIPYSISINGFTFNHTTYNNSFNIFKNQIESQFPQASVTILNDRIFIEINNTSQTFTQLTLTPNYNIQPSIYNFIEGSCNLPLNYNNIVLNEGNYKEWSKYVPSKKELDYHNLENIAQGKELNYSFNDVENYFELDLTNLSLDKEFDCVFIFKIKGEMKNWYKNDEIITSIKVLNYLQKKYQSNFIEQYKIIQSDYNAKELNRRIKAQIESQAWLDDYDKKQAEENAKIVFPLKPIETATRPAVATGPCIERWIGFFDSMYSSATTMRNGSFSNTPMGQIIPGSSTDSALLQANLETGMGALTKQHRSSARSWTGGWGSTNYSESESNHNNTGYSDAVSEFMDLNGDRYPELITSNEIQTTKMTGGHRPLVGHGLSDISVSDNYNGTLTTTAGKVIAGLKQIGSAMGFKGTPPMNGESKSSGSPADFIGISASLEGEDKEKNSWLDINGDGLPDKIYDNGGFQLNKGNSMDSTRGFANLNTTSSEPTSFNLSLNLPIPLPEEVPFGLQAGASGSGSDSTVTFEDINGDGLVDILNVPKDSGNAKVRYNLGNKFSSLETPVRNSTLNTNDNRSFSLSGSGTAFWGFPICCWFLDLIYLKFGATLSASVNLTLSDVKKSYKDFNGDGFVDYIETTDDNIKVYPSIIGSTNMLKSVLNPLGGSFEMDYKVQPVTYDNPHAKWALSSVVINDGYNKLNDGNDFYRKDLVYENAKYDRRERDFYGYETVKVIDYKLNPNNSPTATAYRTSVSKFYNNSYFMNGMLKESYVVKGADVSGAQKFSRTINNYEIKKLDYTNNQYDGTNLPMTFDVGGTEGRRSAGVVLKDTTNELYELAASAQITSKIEMDYDEKGRVTSFYSRGDLSVTTDDYSSTITYHSTPNLIAKNILNAAKEIRVFDNNGVMQRLRRTEVDLNGAVKKIEALMTSANQGSSTIFATTDLTHNTYGNLSSILYPENLVSERMGYKYGYDIDFNKYVVSIEDSFGYNSSAKYDPYFDKVTETTDLAGNKMIYRYDRFGRTINIIAPKEILTDKPYTIKFNYYPKFTDFTTVPDGLTITNFVPVAVTQHYDQNNPTNDIETLSFIDGLARPIQIKKDISLNRNADPRITPDYYEALSVSGKVTYDQYGRSIAQFHPLSETKDVNLKYLFNNGTSPITPSTVTYDELDRTLTSIDSEGNDSAMTYSIEADNTGLLAIKTKSDVNQNGSQHIITETYKDANGRSSATKNVGGNSGAIWTNFEYDALGQIKKYTDTEGLSTEYKYDRLGRKLSVNHPDNGETKFAYDPVGNLKTLQTANMVAANAFVKYEYEYSRLKKVSYPEVVVGSPNVANVEYQYGTASLTGADANKRGRLILQKDATGQQTFEYGNMGEMIRNTRIVVGPTIQANRFKTIYEYDSWNRLVSMVYPDDETINYQYDLGGNLNRMIGSVNGSPFNYIDRIDYDQYEQRTYLRYGNQTETLYNYTANLRRLNNLNVKTADGNDLYNNTYQYDKVGNVTSLRNIAQPTDIGKMGGKYDHSFKYDNLNRLSVASGVFRGDYSQIFNGNDYESNYGLNMVYNDTHGISEKNQSHIRNNDYDEKNCYTSKYSYYPDTHKLAKVYDDYNGGVDNFEYDLNGNMIGQYKSNMYSGDSSTRQMFWDESNRLRIVADNFEMQHYIYDANGERVFKASSAYEAVYENGTLVTPTAIVFSGYTTYPSGFIVLDPYGNYSKHYYAGSQRIVSRLGDQPSSIFNTPEPIPCPTCKPGANGALDPKALQEAQKADLQFYLDKNNLGKATFKPQDPITIDVIETKIKQADSDPDDAKTNLAERAPVLPIYFYHPDHLGTSTFLTDANGFAYQFFLNLPFGETMAEQLPSTYYQTPYKFNGKELDQETGLYYYGARYYDPRISIWLSVDPLAEKMPSWSPYSFCFNNPIKFVDPDGREPFDWFKNASGRVVWFDSTAKNLTDTGGGKWSNVGANLNEVKQNLNVPSGVDSSKWTTLTGFLSSGKDSEKRAFGIVNPIVFNNSAQVTYDLNVKNTGENGALVSGKTEISGISVNARVSSETFAPGMQITGVGGNFGIQQWTPTGLSLTSKSSPFQDFKGAMLSNAPFHATSDATLNLSLSTYKNLTNTSSGQSTGLNLSFDTFTVTKNQATAKQAIFDIPK